VSLVQVVEQLEHLLSEDKNETDSKIS